MSTAGLGRLPRSTYLAGLVGELFSEFVSELVRELIDEFDGP